MTSLVRYVPDGRILNLSALRPEDFHLIASLRGTITRKSGLILECLSPGGDPAMYVRKDKDGRYWACHFPGGAHGSHPVVPETDEHRRQKDYHVRAAEAAGWTAEPEFSTGQTKLDVRISGGPVPTGIEVQHSDITAALAKSRTTKSYRAGYTVAWFNDRGSRPSFLKEVPAYGCNPQPWRDRLPEAGSATATGLVRIKAVRCEIGAFERCPEGYTRPCGKFHPKPEPWRGLKVDDVVAKIPAAEIVPMEERTGIYLTSPDSLARHQDLTGGSGRWLPGGERREQPPDQRRTVLCENPNHDSTDSAIETFMLNPTPEGEEKSAQAQLPWAARELGRYPGRCKFCGWHIAQMGHAPRCGAMH